MNDSQAVPTRLEGTSASHACLFPDSAPPRVILVICTGRIGDVLLATPVSRSLKARWPDAQIDMLVFSGTGDVLENNPDIRDLISVAPRASLARRSLDARKIWRTYDLACTLNPSSVASLYCWMAGRKRIGIVAPNGKGRLKRLLLTRFVIDRDDVLHVVESGASTMSLLGVSPCFEVVPPSIQNCPEQLARLNLLLMPLSAQPFVVVHMYARYAYKLWHTAGWKALIEFLHERGYAIVLTGGPGVDEADYARGIGTSALGQVINLIGQLSLAATAEVIRRAQLYVGPDTSTSHIAAATGTPTIAVFGPSNPVRWGPWPKGWTGPSPWKRLGSGRNGNVYLIQAFGACVPCTQEGCDANIHSKSDCLSALDARHVIHVVAEILDIRTRDKTFIPIIPEPYADGRSQADSN